MALSFVDVVLVANAVLLSAGTAAGAIWGLRRIEFERKLATAVLIAARAVRPLGARVRNLGVRRHAARLGAAAWKTAARVGLLAGHASRHVWRRVSTLGVRRHVTRLGAGAFKIAAAVGVMAGRAGRNAWRRLRALGARRHVARLGHRARASTVDVPSRANVVLARGLRTYALAAYRLQLWTARTVNAGARLAPRLPRPDTHLPDEDQARRLNALGAQLRRGGDHEQAAERHRVALDIVRDLGDEQAEALTLNNLALALAHSGAEEEAVEHLEHAREVLHELGDEEHEAQVIANLGIVHRRQGHEEVAETLLHEALKKLPPESPAYRQVEQELIRAG